MDKIAKTVGLTPEEFRRRNFIHEGETTATTQIIRERVDMDQLLTKALQLSDYHSKRARFARENLETNGRFSRKRGVGFATFMHGAGFTGSGEVYLQSIVSAEATAEGKVRVLAASTEIGQGTNTIFSQIAAEALGLDLDAIEIVQPDTGLVPNSGPTVASRTAMIVGKLVESAVTGLKQTLIGSGFLSQRYGQTEFEKACAEYIAKFGSLKTSATYQPPPNVHWDEEKYQGDAYGAYAWAVYVAEVSFDELTYEAQVEDFVALQEVGRVLNPVLAAGQIEGGVAQAIGFTLFENVVWKEGRMANNQMTNYIIPTPADIPPIRVYFEENPYAYGPGGAKGIGELPMDGAAPAILNALENATGVSFNRIPLMPETLVESLGR
jgi:CO/xanthine dehydrogenase Mo-binding subunit